MKETHDFLIPDYFKIFTCKMGKCRSTCCVGWPITVSYKDYNKLIGMDCDKVLRAKLDCGLRLFDFPTEDEYARLEPNYDGNCRLRASDGRCALQAECGEDAIPDICCLYPRGIRVFGNEYECSLANSCEGVVELLAQKKEPITFLTEKLTVRMPIVAKRQVYFETLGLQRQIRLYFIKIMQNKNYSLPIRLVRLGSVIKKVDGALKNKDKTLLTDVLNSDPYVDLDEQDNTFVNENQLKYGLIIAEKMVDIFDAQSQSLKSWGREALAYFNGGDGDIQNYLAAKNHFESLFPDWQRFYENLLVNHMFFSEFPFQDRPESIFNEFIALSSVYALLRFLAIGCMARCNDKEKLADVIAATFRLIDHTEYDRYALRVLKNAGCLNKENLLDLISL